MSWLISLVLAGVMFASDGGLPVAANHNFTESKFAAEKTARADETERFEQTYPLGASGRVSVSNVNGSIAVEVWDRNEVRLEYVKTADTRENLAEAEIRIDARQDAFSVETDYGDRNRRNSGNRKNYGKLQIDYRLTVPRNAVLDEIETVNGSVGITGAGGATKASAVNGAVKATNLRGAANLSTVNGTVEADFDQLPAGSRISLNTVNGQANLIIPSDASATIKADTVNGNIVNDFGLPVRKGEYVGRDLYGKIGGGDARIHLNSVNGGLSIKRKNDGKTVNPATNLLTTKNADDWNEGEDAENNFGVRPPRPPRPPRAPRAPKPPRGVIDNDEINKAIEEGLKDAQKELAKIKPELRKIELDALNQAEVQINSPEMQARIKEAQVKSKEIMARLADINWSAGAPSVEEKSESFAVKGIPKVTIDAQNCPVAVRGWDKPEVRYSLVRISRDNQNKPLEAKTAIGVKAEDSEISIKVLADTDSPGGISFDEATKMRLEVFVPKKSNLKVAANREIRLEGVSGAIDLQGADEAIDIRDAGGKLSVAAADGRIRVIGFTGEITAETSDGAINLEGDFHNLAARTVDGTIVLTLPENADANIESNRKDIVGEGVALVYQADGKSASTWKIGKGGENYRLYAAADGRVIVRNAKQLQK